MKSPASDRIAVAPPRNDRTSGLTLVEIVVALGLFSVMVLSVAFTLVRGIEHRRQSFLVYRATSALRGLMAEIQDTANQPQNLSAGTGIGAIYGKYHGKTVAAAGLPSGQIVVTCYPNEMTVPSNLGGPQDLNLDGDAGDDLGNLSAGTDLKIVPLTLSITYTSGLSTLTTALDRLVTKTTN